MTNTYEQKMCKNKFFTKSGTTFVNMCWSFDQKQALVKIVQKWAIFTKQSPKND